MNNRMHDWKKEALLPLIYFVCFFKTDIERDEVREPSLLRGDMYKRWSIK